MAERQVPPCPPTPCREWMGSRSPQGYGKMRRNGKTHLVHRWVMGRVFGAKRISSWVVMHRCDNPSCYRYDHLWLGTHRDNVNDMITKERQQRVRGEHHHQAKLRQAEVEEIRAAKAIGEPNTAIAKRYGVAASTVSNIINGWTWQTQ